MIIGGFSWWIFELRFETRILLWQAGLGNNAWQEQVV